MLAIDAVDAARSVNDRSGIVAYTVIPNYFTRLTDKIQTIWIQGSLWNQHTNTTMCMISKQINNNRAIPVSHSAHTSFSEGTLDDFVVFIQL